MTFPQWNTTKTMIKSSTKNQKLHWRKWAKSGESQHCPELKFICLLSKSFRASGLFFFLSLSHMQRIYESVFSSVVQRISSDQRRRSARRILQSCVLLSAHHLCKQFCPSGWIRVCWKVRSKTWSSRPCVCVSVCTCKLSNVHACVDLCDSCLCLRSSSSHFAAAYQQLRADDCVLCVNRWKRWIVVRSIHAGPQLTQG